MTVKEKLSTLKQQLGDGVELVAVSKTYPPQTILEAYEAGQRTFGENRPQEMKTKHEELPKDIRWHLIGQLQTNKVKYIAPFVELIHSVDNHRLLEVINKEAAKNDRVIDVLMQVYIAQEETKNGWDTAELVSYIESGKYRECTNVRLRGVMGIATFTEDMDQVRREFCALRDVFDEIKGLLPELGTEFEPEANSSTSADKKMGNTPRFDILSMGMSSDWQVAVECGANMVRIGSTIFGSRNYGGQ